MLAEQRFNEIMRLVEEKGNVTVSELTELLNASEATIRRDLSALSKEGRLRKVFGGAVSNSPLNYMKKDIRISERELINVEEKKRIAEYAASLIKDDDFVYIDAGSTTGFMAEYITRKNAAYVTNSMRLAGRLAERGFDVSLPGGRLKYSTEAITGGMAIVNLLGYQFTIGFWGTNGIDRKMGFTTPDSDEAAVKRVSMERCSSCYVLCDHEKFEHRSMVSFADFDSAVIITDKVLNAEFAGNKNIIETDRLYGNDQSRGTDK